MSKINLMSLGGLNENGKNMYVLDIDGSILVFDAGLKFAPDKMYGIDYIIPDFDYLIKRKDKIKGVFITHAHYENMGSLTDLVREIPEVNVYCTNFTSKILLEEAKEDDVVIKNLHVIKPYKKINMGEFSIFPFMVTHSVPESVGYSVNTKDGAIIYMGDFIIDPTMSGFYEMDLGKVAYIGKQGVLCLMCESVFAEKSGFTAPKHKLENYFKNVVEKNKNRIIFTILPLHIYTMQEIFNSLKGKHRKVIIMGKKLQSIVNVSIKNGYLDVEKDLIGDLSDLNRPDAVIMVCNDRETPFYNLSRIVNGYDKYVKLKETDTVCFAEPSYDAYENTLVKIMNDIAIKGANIETVPKEKSVRHHASSEDLMLIIKLFNPKYYMPIKGEYRYMVGNANLAEAVGVNKNNIILKENGERVVFDGGVKQESFDRIKVDEVLIDGKSTTDVGELVIKDREMLADNGLVLVSATLDKKTKNLIAGPEVLTRGFIYVKENKDIIEKIKEISLDIINENINNHYADYANIRNGIRESLGKFLYSETECKPMVLTVIQEV